jgi:hypothetical protein
MRWLVPLIASLTLGLAPFAPEPHLVEKIRWLVVGHRFRPVDVFDLALHGAPWVWLLWTLMRRT